MKKNKEKGITCGGGGVGGGGNALGEERLQIRIEIWVAK
jgi:hypothetical protein